MYVTLANHLDEHHDVCDIAEAPVSQAQVHARRAVSVGHHLFHEGDEAHNIYEVASGLLRLTRVLENGSRQVIAFALPGDVVGFPDGDVHHTDCDVLVAGEVISYRRQALESGAGDPTVHTRLLQAALKEISGMQDHFMMLARKSAPEKVASFLMVMAERTGTFDGGHTRIVLPMKRSDIADFLGLTIETVCRAITRLRKARIIALEDAQTVIILDNNRLENAALLD
ncbi:MAG: helix-turn-helix domain-containing protein [Hyphomicrobiales bacterium]|jgi:CRP-like cAMP-binding protein